MMIKPSIQNITDDDNSSNENNIARSITCLTLRPVFLYGTLMSSRVLAGLLTGDERNFKTVEGMREKATLPCYSRHAVIDADYPAVVKGTAADFVNGFLFHPENLHHLQLLDSFESDSYSREEVKVIDSRDEEVEAYTYVWCDEMESLDDVDWSLEEFEKKWFR